MIYNTIVKPHFTFCVTVLYQAFITDINKLQVLQNKGMRAILKCGKRVPVQNMLNILGWINIKDLIGVSGMCYIYKMQNRLLPEYLAEKLVPMAGRHDHVTRNSYKYNLGGCSRQSMIKSLFYTGVREYNALPATLKRVNTVEKFKK